MTSTTTPVPATGTLRPRKRKRSFMWTFLWVAVDLILGVGRLVVVFARRRGN